MSDNKTGLTGMFGELLAPFKPVTEIFADYPFVLTMLIMVLAVIVASIASAIVIKVIGRMVKRTNVRWDDQLIAAFHRPLFWSLVFIGVLLALEPLGLPQTAENIFQSIIATTLVVIWTSFLLRFIRIVLRAMSRSAREHSMVRPQTEPLFENLGFIIALAVAIYLIFRSWDIDMTAWLASAGVVGIAVGFAAKDTLANLFSGVFILADAPYKIGDYVVLDAGERGKAHQTGYQH